MCGIIGVVTKRATGLISSDIDAVRDLLIADASRGQDGTGIAYVNMAGDRKLKAYYSKEPNAPQRTIDRSTLRKNLSRTRCVIGHNRAATVGDIVEEHTHPFSYNSVIGVHNGTIHGWKHYFGKYGYKEATMDSQALLESISLSAESPEAIADLLCSISYGAYALVWYDSRNHTLRFVRNDERPLHMCKTDDSLWWASERKMLEWALDRNKKTIQSAWSLRPHVILSIPLLGGETEVHDFSKKASIRSIGGWSSWRSSWPLARGATARYASGGAVAARPAYTMNIALFRPFDLTESLSKKTETKLNTAVSNLLGVDFLSCARQSSLDFGFNQTLCKNLPSVVHGATISGSSTPMAPVYIADVDARRRLVRAFVLAEDGETGLPISLAGSINTITAQGIADLEKIILNDHIPQIASVPIFGIKLWHHGYWGFYGGGVYNKDIVATHKIEGKWETLAREFGTDHPDATAYASSGAPNWNKGWKEVTLYDYK